MNSFQKWLLVLLLLSAGDIFTADSYCEIIDQDPLSERDSISANKADLSLVQADSTEADQKSLKDHAQSGVDAIKNVITLAEIVWSIIIVLVGYLIIRVTIRILGILAEKSTKHRITIKGFIPVVKILGWVLLITVIIVGVFQPPYATVLAFSASVGVAIGFAAQDILKNIFGGIMILFDRPFQTGDKIEVGSHYGEVIEIGLRSTRIVTPDDSVVSIPNSEVMNNSVSNANMGESNCLVVAEIYLPLTVDTRIVREIAVETAQVSKYVYLNKPITVIFVNEFKERQSLLKMRLKAYVFDIRDEFKFKSEMTEIVLRTLIEQKIIPAQSSFLNFQPQIN